MSARAVISECCALPRLRSADRRYSGFGEFWFAFEMVRSMRPQQGGDFQRIRFLMDAPLSPRFPFEMFHRIGDINLFPIDAGFHKRLMENLSGQSDKRMSLNVFLIARLFAHEHHSRFRAAFPKHALCSTLPKVARTAIGGNSPQLRDRWIFRN